MPRAARSRRNWPRYLILGSLLALITVALLGGILVFWLRGAAQAALPQIDGDIRVSSDNIRGLSAPVTVRRDGHGVPHIDAASQEDLFVAQGYVTAQDRLWQMDAYRRSFGTTRCSACSSFVMSHTGSTPTSRRTTGPVSKRTHAG